MNSFGEMLFKASQDIGISLSNENLTLFELFSKELIFWNEKMSLISVRSPCDLIIKHHIDSLSIIPLIRNHEARILDIGSGAGFPGIPLKIVIRTLQLTLLDSSRKKISFLKNVIRKLKLEKSVTLCANINDLMQHGEKEQGSYDIVVSRAAFKLPFLIEAADYFLRKGGILIAMKGRNIRTELEESESIIRRRCFLLQNHQEIQLPVSGDVRNLIVFQK